MAVSHVKLTSAFAALSREKFGEEQGERIRPGNPARIPTTGGPSHPVPASVPEIRDREFAIGALTSASKHSNIAKFCRRLMVDRGQTSLSLSLSLSLSIVSLSDAFLSVVTIDAPQNRIAVYSFNLASVMMERGTVSENWNRKSDL